MRGSKGGMQTVAANYSLYCEKCGKPAARREESDTEIRYMHFTKKGSVWHIFEKESETWKTKRSV